MYCHDELFIHSPECILMGFLNNTLVNAQTIRKYSTYIILYYLMFGIRNTTLRTAFAHAVVERYKQPFQLPRSKFSISSFRHRKKLFLISIFRRSICGSDCIFCVSNRAAYTRLVQTVVQYLLSVGTVSECKHQSTPIVYDYIFLCNVVACPLPSPPHERGVRIYEHCFQIAYW